MSNNESSQKILFKYKLTNKITNNTNNIINKDISILSNDSQKNLLVKTGNTLNPGDTNKLMTSRDLDKTNNYYIINNLSTYRKYQEKNANANLKKDKNYLKYTQGLSVGNLYSEYESENKKTKKINYSKYKSPNKNLQFLPNIYKNSNSVNKYGINRKKY